MGPACGMSTFWARVTCGAPGTTDKVDAKAIEDKVNQDGETILGHKDSNARLSTKRSSVRNLFAEPDSSDFELSGLFG